MAPCPIHFVYKKFLTVQQHTQTHTHTRTHTHAHTQPGVRVSSAPLGFPALHQPEGCFCAFRSRKGQGRCRFRLEQLKLEGLSPLLVHAACQAKETVGGRRLIGFLATEYFFSMQQ
mmetsp:Transcript_34818/g.58122  ORF Transcript_34818/g.58122 Transcript_34818/m.58122 type:complete len:116 (-) Transcript_34818:800-1147(-)